MRHPTSAAAAPPARAARSGEPPALVLVLIFWAAFSAAAIFVQIANPEVFARVDPDSVLRLVEVRDLLAGQGWFDLVQHRMDSPAGVLMHWSRLIDAPLAGLVLAGNALSINGEAVALTLWPLLLLLATMASSAVAAAALAGPGAVVPAALMWLLFYVPLGTFVPGSIDHHNAQLALATATLAAALRLRQRPAFGLAAGVGAALMLAVGLETLVFVAIIGTAAALAWAFTGQGARGTAWFGLAFAAAPALLFVLTGSPSAPSACDALSWTYAVPALVAGGGLASLAAAGDRLDSRAARMAALAVVAAASLAAFLLIAPECRAGPYGTLSAEFDTLFLQGVAEAQPWLATVPAAPAGAIAAIAAPIIACAIALGRALSAAGEARQRWATVAVLASAAVVLSFYQVRGTVFANAFAIPILAAWIAELAARRGMTSLLPFKRSRGVIAAFVLIMPILHLAAGTALVLAFDSAVGPGQPAARSGHDSRDEAPLSNSECLDRHAGGALSALPEGRVIAPLFYGSSVLALSPHSVVAGPYHRGEAAMLDTLRAMSGAPDEAEAIVAGRGVDYVVVCSSAEEVVATARESPSGLLALLVAGDIPAWLDPVPPAPDTPLRIFSVRGSVAGTPSRWIRHS